MRRTAIQVRFSYPVLVACSHGIVNLGDEQPTQAARDGTERAIRHHQPCTLLSARPFYPC